MALESQGIKVFWSTATSHATAATCAIDEVNSISGPSGGAGVIDVTHLLSTAKEKLMGLPDEGQITLECNLTSNLGSTGYQGNLRDSRESRKKGSFRLKLSTDNYIEGKGFVTTLNPSAGIDDKIGLSVTIEITGRASYVST